MSLTINSFGALRWILPVATLLAAAPLTLRAQGSPPSEGGNGRVGGAPELVEPGDPTAEVAVLLYHNFTEDKPNLTTVNIEDFKKQMKALSDAGIPVISHRDFLDWKAGKKSIPKRAALISIDDGWKSTYTLAFPVLKQYGYPFAIYLYPKFLSGRGQSLSVSQVKEMMKSGCTVGSHTLSHDFLIKPRQRANSRLTGQAKLDWQKKEIVESKSVLEKMFGVEVTYFSYPYGQYNDAIVKMCFDAGYEAMFTVDAQKCTASTPNGELGRYDIQGNNLWIFDRATKFSGTSTLLQGAVPVATFGQDNPDVLVTTSPMHREVVQNLTPRIEVDLSKIEDLDPASLEMVIAGIGPVDLEGKFDKESKILMYQVRQRLRLPECQVRVHMKRKGKDKVEKIQFAFFVDQVGAVLEMEKTTGPLSEPAAGRVEPSGRTVPQEAKE